MPYIKAAQRTQFDECGLERAGQLCESAGELNYCISKIMKGYVKKFATCNYQTINDIMGAATGALLEFYRRQVAPYENQKIQENGDIYEN